MKRAIAVIAAAVILAAVFFAGYFTRKLTQPEYVSSYEWVMKTIKENYYYDFDEKACRGLSLKEIGAKLDRYSDYYTAEEYKKIYSDNAGEKSGVGITYNFVPEKSAVIVTVAGNSPAYLGGIRAGDILTGGYYVDGEEKKEVKFDSAEKFSGFIDKRETGEKFSLVSKDGDGKEESFEVSKEFYTASYAFYATKKTAWEVRYTADAKEPSLYESPKDKIGFLPEGTAYIRLNQFFGNAGDEFGRLTEKFNADGCGSLIIDLRNNGGGYVSVMQDIAGYFTSGLSQKTSVAMTARYKNGKTEVYNCVKHSGAGVVSKDKNIYVLANSGTASASEALIGVLVSYGCLKYENIFISKFSDEYMKFAGAEAKTERSYGKGIMQTTFTRRTTGEALKLTTAQIYWPDGSCIHDAGLTKKNGCRLSAAEWTATKGDKELENIIAKYFNG